MNGIDPDDSGQGTELIFPGKSTGVCVMAKYRMYSLNEFGRISYAEDLDAEDDQQAVALVRELSPKARICEVWESRRLVATIKAGDFLGVSA